MKINTAQSLSFNVPSDFSCHFFSFIALRRAKVALNTEGVKFYHDNLSLLRLFYLFYCYDIEKAV